jgi:hypothetical protein
LKEKVVDCWKDSKYGSIIVEVTPKAMSGLMMVRNYYPIF